MNRENIIFSTSRQWNPGDEFILKGILNLFEEAEVEFNPIIYNRNPAVTNELDHFNIIKERNFFKSEHWSNPLSIIASSIFNIRDLDNSIRKRHLRDKWIDKIVIAGSPEVFGFRHISLFKYANKFDIPIYLLGVGLPKSTDKLVSLPIYKKMIPKIKYISTRNVNSNFKRIQALNKNIYYNGCPALFVSKEEIEINPKKNSKIRMGIIFSFPEGPQGHRLKREEFVKIKKIIRELSEKMRDKIEIGFIFHYVDEIFLIESKYRDLKEYANAKIYYSYNSEEYLEIYKKFDIVMSTRVHGNGLASSLGIPNIALVHDERSSVVEFFDSKKIEISKIKIEQLLKEIKNIITNLKKINQDLIENKRNKKEIWIREIRKLFNKSDYK